MICWLFIVSGVVVGSIAMLVSLVWLTLTQGTEVDAQADSIQKKAKEGPLRASPEAERRVAQNRDPL